MVNVRALDHIRHLDDPGNAPNISASQKPSRYSLYHERPRMKGLSDIYPEREGGITRGPITWYCYLMSGFFMYLLTIQGNIIPFLRSELHLSYGAVILHSSAFAAPGFVTGMFGDWLIRRYGRRRVLWLGALGMSAGAALLCLASAAWFSIGSCAVMGASGGLIWIVVTAVLSELHGERRNVALAEASAVAYAFGIVAPLVTSLCLSLALGWRNALLVGVVFGGMILLWFGRMPLPDSAVISTPGHARLPAPYWIYWCALTMAIAIEFCILLWAPEFLQHVVGLSAASSAAAAAVFGLAMLTGRTAGSSLLRVIAAQRLFPLALLVTCLGFLIYWGLPRPPLAIVGLFVLGLGVALLYPLALGLAMGAAGTRADTASARAALAGSLGILVTPALLGGLADKIGLHLAHLIVPALAVVALICFVTAQALQRQTKLYQSG